MAPRVLVVEDNPVNLELVAALLESEAAVDPAETADASSGWLRRSGPISS